MGPAMKLWLWSCKEWPADTAVNYGSITTLPYCTRLNYCFSFGQALSMDVSQKAKVCQGSQTVGLLYSTGQALPASGNSKDMVSGCSCSDPETGKSSVFTCDDPKAMKAFGQADKSNPFVCVNPLKACSGSESDPPSLGKPKPSNR
ncbi:uncharacterized protein PGTG_18069 [Puccinia graminis f. sp. tritici CRL 75-36-700-3]|uniref:Uncharacterized protein n=2 Tax=Puccinia graminis f. sp. tritici TaxID=56615 RepID=E3L5Q0_PUCGT|nr:uncharacterized protein PGTG_18069 [Puccinia graminis f. sp. tritici CRL 75-36-700-3]EFP91875.2 hypothetical protein PGTG_18069 [Puccinia graminis f. sp. tritici CRL 75-36-700-3]